MTVTYSLEVSRVRVGGFAKLLVRWRGSIYKLMYREMIVFTILYYSVALLYRGLLKNYDVTKRVFEAIAIYCRTFTDLIPITFVMGFYVAIVVGRWWHQYEAIPWPDRCALQIGAYIQGMDERGRTIRRSLVRYLNLIAVLTYRCVSTVIRKRFPTMDHVLEAGLCTVDERLALDDTVAPHGNWWVPSSWFCQLVMVARKEGRIHDDLHLKSIVDEMMHFRGCCGLMWSYDWISVPLVYTQVVTIAVYSFFFGCLLGRQYLYVHDVNNAVSFDVDYYVPVLTMLQFFFYIGWLKVAEQLICPFGEDDDDFELNWVIDRNLQVSYMCADALHRKYPKLTRDIHWDDLNVEMPYTAAAAEHKCDPFMGSTANMNIATDKMEWINEDDPRLDVIKEKLNHISDEDMNGEADVELPSNVDSRHPSYHRGISHDGLARSPSNRPHRKLFSLLSGNSRLSINRLFGSTQSIHSLTNSSTGRKPFPTSPRGSQSHTNRPLVEHQHSVPVSSNRNVAAGMAASLAYHQRQQSIRNRRPSMMRSDSVTSSCWANDAEEEIERRRAMYHDSILSMDIVNNPQHHSIADVRPHGIIPDPMLVPDTPREQQSAANLFININPNSTNTNPNSTPGTTAPQTPNMQKADKKLPTYPDVSPPCGLLVPNNTSDDQVAAQQQQTPQQTTPVINVLDSVPPPSFDNSTPLAPVVEEELESTTSGSTTTISRSTSNEASNTNVNINTTLLASVQETIEEESAAGPAHTNKMLAV